MTQEASIAELVLEVSVGTGVIDITGATAGVGTKTVYWTVDPTRDGGVVAAAKAHLRPTLFHEFHHIVRGPVGASLMDRVIYEGLASAFERDFAGAPYPWTAYPEDVSEWVTELMALPSTAEHQHWMMRHPDGRRWIGDKAGAYLVDQAVKASGQSVADLAVMPTEAILQLALGPR